MLTNIMLDHNNTEYTHMKSRINNIAVACLFGTIVTSVQAGTDMNGKEISKYLGVIACVDRTFFDGGYQVGDKTRESLMTDFLAKQSMPEYSEEIFSKESEIKKDTASYMEGYMTCDNDYDNLTKTAQSHNVAAEDY